MNEYPAWLNNSVFYEIYPQSFRDSNGDGIGDLNGIIGKLDYIRSLGVDAIWLNPCFASPFADAGYDVSDYCRIAPRYGTNADMARLCQMAHAKGLRVILDLVAGHTSIEHPWFQASSSGAKSSYDDYFVWTDGWGQETGAYRFINGYGRRDGTYMINFFYCQPALNYGFCDQEYPWQQSPEAPACVAVREEMKRVMKFWLDLGCDGFRVDMASSLIKGRDAYPGLKVLWHYYRDWLRAEYPEAVLISEWSRPALAIEAGFHVDFMVHFNERGYTDLLRQEPERIGNSPFAVAGKRSFFDRCGEGDASTFFDDLVRNLKQIGRRGLVSIPTGNHDIGRISAGRDTAELKALYAMIFTLPGVPFLYYGDEIGMKNIYGLGNVEGSYNRSAARTPMQWTPDGDSAGFSAAAPADFYLPIDPDTGRPNVEAQEPDPDSLLNFTRRLIALRRANRGLQNDQPLTLLYQEPGQAPIVYQRGVGAERFVIAVNPFGREVCATFALNDADRFETVLAVAGVKLHPLAGCTEITLPQASYAIYRYRG